MRCHITADTTTNSTGHITFKYVELHAQDLCVNVSNIIECGTVFIFFGGGLEGSHAEHKPSQCYCFTYTIDLCLSSPY